MENEGHINITYKPEQKGLCLCFLTTSALLLNLCWHIPQWQYKHPTQAVLLWRTAIKNISEPSSEMFFIVVLQKLHFKCSSLRCYCAALQKTPLQKKKHTDGRFLWLFVHILIQFISMASFLHVFIFQCRWLL